MNSERDPWPRNLFDDSEDLAPPPLIITDERKAHCIVLNEEAPLDTKKNKWLGGITSFGGEWIYGVPGNAGKVLRIHAPTGVVDEIGDDNMGRYKWLRGEKSEVDGCCYFIPSNADDVMLVNPETQEIERIGGPYPGDWKWHGGNIAANGCIYSIPANATQVLKVDPFTKEVTTFGGPFEGRQKWYGGLLASNGCIYGIPQNACSVLKIDPSNDTCTTFGELGEGGWKYHGGTTSVDGTKIYAVPCHAESILKIDTTTDTLEIIGEGIKSGRHRFESYDDYKYKYLGAARGRHGRIYFFPSEAERVLYVDPENDEWGLIGPIFTEGFNKWQNGYVASDGCVYGIPQSAPGVLRIDPGKTKDSEISVTTLSCGIIDPYLKDKFEGAVECPYDGSVYCIPLNSPYVLKIVPETLE